MSPGRATLLQMLRMMLLIRAFDGAAKKLLETGSIPGVIHLTTGQEGAVVGACTALEPRDYLIGNHRSHGHPIAKGSPTGPLMAELMGKVTGVCRGRGGSQHLADASVRNLVGSAVLGSAVPVAVGAALTSSMLGAGYVVLSCFGDGAANEGAVHESMNLASIWKLPVIFFCENNGYAVTVSARYAVSVTDIAERAAGYGMPGKVVDGQDVLAVYDAVGEAVTRARSGAGPTLVEAKTYRFCDHAENLPTEPYRPTEEVTEWRKRDPIVLFRDRLLSAGLASEDDFEEIEASVGREIASAVQFAEASDFPTVDTLFDGLYTNPPAGRHHNA